MTTGNPVSRALLGRLAPGAPSAERAAFVARWDRFEALVIGVYRAGEADPSDEAAYAELGRWFAATYPRHALALEPHWRAARVGAEPVADDPFAALLACPAASAFAGDWDAMRRLPAAREAVNRWLLAGDASPAVAP